MNPRSHATPPREDGSLAQRVRRRFPRAVAFVAARLDRETALGLELTLALLVIALLLWAFVALADEFPEKGALQLLDTRVVSWMHQRETPAGKTIFAAISWFGSGGLVILGVTLPLGLAARKEWLRAVVWVAAVVGATGLDYTLKLVYRRIRPEFASEYLHSFSWSFPSGHAMISLVAYGLVAFFLLERTDGPFRRRMIVFAAVLVVGSIGFSRIYLGVHYLSDVTAGFLAGGAWLGACILAYQLASSRRPG